MSLRFGTSGIPLSTPRSGTAQGIRRARELGLGCLELAWGNGVRMSESTANRITEARAECGLELTAHAPYYVNLCGAGDVVERSVARVVESGVLAARLGREALSRVHVHVSGIEFGPGGERCHVPLLKSRFRWRDLLRALHDVRASGWVVCETPAMEADALRLQRFYRRTP